MQRVAATPEREVTPQYTMEQIVAVNPYNPDILPDLEAHVQEQVNMQTYSLDANLCLLRLYQVSQKISDVAYRLKLPEGWRIHNAFHVSLLRPFVGEVPEEMVPEEEPEVEELDEILIPEQILAHKDRKVKGKVARRYLVKFKNYSPMDAKWMKEAELADSLQLLQLYKEAFLLESTVT
ncbi:hypothetical protein L7F22_061393 [Adiantum nelumboides]|nr:hypothetical protein [Adiantum nelumboides]